MKPKAGASTCTFLCQFLPYWSEDRRMRSLKWFKGPTLSALLLSSFKFSKYLEELLKWVLSLQPRTQAGELIYLFGWFFDFSFIFLLLLLLSPSHCLVQLLHSLCHGWARFQCLTSQIRPAMHYLTMELISPGFAVFYVKFFNIIIHPHSVPTHWYLQIDALFHLLLYLFLPLHLPLCVVSFFLREPHIFCY